MSRAELEMRDRIKQRSLRNSYHGFRFRDHGGACVVTT
jgi:hypothetical protein